MRGFKPVLYAFLPIRSRNQSEVIPKRPVSSHKSQPMLTTSYNSHKMLPTLVVVVVVVVAVLVVVVLVDVVVFSQP